MWQMYLSSFIGCVVTRWITGGSRAGIISQFSPEEKNWVTSALFKMIQNKGEEGAFAAQIYKEIN